MYSDQKSLLNLKKHVNAFPDTLVILGSGWNRVLEDVKIKKRIGYDKIFGVKSSVPGHNGELIIGKIKNDEVAFMSGRFHTYEGYSARQATTPIRIFAELGLKNLIATSAVGGLNENYRVGDFVILKDLLTIFQVIDNPLVGPEFVDMSQIFSTKFIDKATSELEKRKIRFHQGIFVYYHGPNYESPADKRALRMLGADVCGMSMVPEVIMAKSLNLNILGLAFVTNLAFVKHDHKEVIRRSEQAGEKMKKLITGII